MSPLRGVTLAGLAKKYGKKGGVRKVNCYDFVLLYHREEMYREETRGKLCHADIFSLLTIENYIISLFY